MTPRFTVNFRRETYLREVRRTRRRLVALGAWVAYFGVLGLLIGLYALNGASLTHRIDQVERQAAHFRRVPGAPASLSLSEAELGQIERCLANPAQWRDRLVRLATILPPNARLTWVAVNPQNMSNAAEQNRLVIAGELRPAKGQDRMQGVMKIVSALHDDSVFAAGYRNIKLTSTRAAEGSGANAEFVIECR